MAKALPVTPLEVTPLPESRVREGRRGLTLIQAREASLQPLVMRLALDRLRELHDDGVTMDYIARMYGVSGGSMREVETELRRFERSGRQAPEAAERC